MRWVSSTITSVHARGIDRAIDPTRGLDQASAGDASVLTQIVAYLILLALAEVAEQADAHDSKSCSFGSVGSIPTFGTYRSYWYRIIDPGQSRDKCQGASN
jgi:hypothetical protein